ncbi:MAG: LytR C-terminal domain-containing protein, partial [Gemmatimonadaceae bacterium]|nr:LytR C-terminal domain-containing protein [Gemmatimonadaceae bacterium]
MEFGPLNTPPVSAARRRRRRVALVVLLAATAVGLFRVWTSGPGDATGDRDEAAPADRPARVVSDTVRIKVEVLNATSTRGLGRLATAWLRDKGFDVVATGTAPSADRRDSTLVLDRSGHA